MAVGVLNSNVQIKPNFFVPYFSDIKHRYMEFILNVIMIVDYYCYFNIAKLEIK